MVDTLKYLGVILDRHQSYGPHLTKVAEKASKLTAALDRIMPNTKGPSEKKMKNVRGSSELHNNVRLDDLEKGTFHQEVQTHDREGAEKNGPEDHQSLQNNPTSNGHGACRSNSDNRTSGRKM